MEQTEGKSKPKKELNERQKEVIKTFYVYFKTHTELDEVTSADLLDDKTLEYLKTKNILNKASFLSLASANGMDLYINRMTKSGYAVKLYSLTQEGKALGETLEQAKSN